MYFLIIAALAMISIITISNVVVFYNFPYNLPLTYACLTYPFTFLVTDLVNRFKGANSARIIVYIGSIVGGIGSVYFVKLFDKPDPYRVAIASISAFFCGQMFDILVFNRLRQAKVWWKAPLFGEWVGALIDSLLFFTILFYGVKSLQESFNYGVWDTVIKMLMGTVIILPYRRMMNLQKAYNPLVINKAIKFPVS